MDSFHIWHLWVVVALILIIAEVIGAEFFLLALGLSCLFGALAAILGLGLAGQFTFTAVAAAILVPVLVLKVRKVLRAKHNYGTTGTGSERGVELEVIEQAGKNGVKYRGDFLPARYGNGQVPELGSHVIIERIEGITAVVSDAQPADTPDTSSSSHSSPS